MDLDGTCLVVATTVGWMISSVSSSTLSSLTSTSLTSTLLLLPVLDAETLECQKGAGLTHSELQRQNRLWAIEEPVVQGQEFSRLSLKGFRRGDC